VALDTEEERIEAIKSWFRANGLSLLLAVVIVVAAFLAWHFWQQHQASQAMEGATQYQRLMGSINAGKTGDAKRIADGLVKNYAGTPYAAQGDMTMAAYLVAHNKLPAAAKRLDWVSHHASEKNLRHLARLRQARVLRGMGKDEQAMKLLEKGDPGVYKPLYQELRGDILADQGKDKAAVKAYKTALSALPPKDNASRKNLQRKLRSLGGSGSPEKDRS
jgi:predicted negative regulator of RcsB-dependent stress response